MSINTSLPKQRELPSISSERLPWAGLLALAMAGFICILTESLPAGLLPQIAKDLGVTEALTGQLVTLYAIGSLIAAIPLTAATRGWRRRPLLLACISGFLVFNTVTAISSDYILTLAARFMAGVSAGVLWGMTAGYARRMVPDSLKGKAMAVAMVGTPVALALGVPIGSFLSSYIGWRLIFGIVSLLTAALIVWVLWKMPDFAGEPAGERLPLHKVFVIPGVRPILFVVLAWMLAHNILYTYISPYLAQTVFANRVDLILLIFGITSIMGIWLTGMLIDRFLRRLVIISLAAFALASVVMGIGTDQPVMIILGIMIWGLTFGGAATLLQTAIAQAGGKSTDVAQSMLVTAWNLAIGGGGIIGGILLEVFGAGYLSGALFILLIPALLVAMRAYKYGFTRAN
ncbi:putative MFS family arabinose efflux permease [Paenibacillus sp. W4I10]|uniref:MFS transporter n=1 Tax=Paenibacillus sp. W4I10 TaxID=3042298 RepID=UPI0027819B14|nr:MFS transporter [Paenibacillus sp. W4I10]MDQ0718833.1 putative MFS family arabinose efflux permease [Paenibacillus sp. W4I10]